MSRYIVVCDEETASWIGNDVNYMQRLVCCCDCKYYVKDPAPLDPGWQMMCADTGRDMLEPYGFCAWGERKADA